MIKYFNDKALTENNLSPLYTSTVDVKYIGRLYDDVAFDSSYTSTSPADSVTRFKLNNLIEGWVVGLTDMHIGDSCELIIPYEFAYGATGSSSINPYSNLRFNLKLVDIPGYVIPVN